MTTTAQRSIAFWLLGICVMIFVMVVLGGVTRLTESGLSMVEWRPVTGFLPPLSDEAWERAFRIYRESPEFIRVNFWMTLADFKTIYWMEFIHRLWGRAIGIAFLLPFLYFVALRRADGKLTLKLVLAFVLGGLQGVLGWYMVKSGLVDRPDVSQYRLAAHLGLALAIYLYLLWLALNLLSPRQKYVENRSPGGLRAPVVFILAWALVTAIWGAFVAGMDAGQIYNTFPLMGDTITPDNMFSLDPWPINFFENAATVQFTHRVLAVSLLLIVILFWIRALRGPANGRLRLASSVLAATAVTQAGLGIATLLGEVQIAVAATHQAGALVLLTVTIWTLFETLPALDPARERR
jgi:heme a synthase